MEAQIVGERICKLRKSRGLTQQQLADELFVTNKVISKWETGLGLPDTALLPALASALGVTVDDLVADDGSMIKGEYSAKCVSIGENGSKTRVVKKLLLYLSRYWFLFLLYIILYGFCILTILTNHLLIVGFGRSPGSGLRDFWTIHRTETGNGQYMSIIMMKAVTRFGL